MFKSQNIFPHPGQMVQITEILGCQPKVFMASAWVGFLEDETILNTDRSSITFVEGKPYGKLGSERNPDHRDDSARRAVDFIIKTIEPLLLANCMQLKTINRLYSSGEVSIYCN
jgi:hypothetical protein